uniref:Uncharacterized protein n=1 Tax=Variovorax paradoxus (strain S110) TaxID=543728 RepID=C5CJL4_VARPS
MSNMSYCRFRNTLSDLRDCYENLDEAVSSDEESAARRRLIELCCDIFDEFGHEVGRESE